MTDEPLHRRTLLACLVGASVALAGAGTTTDGAAVGEERPQPQSRPYGTGVYGAGTYGGE